MITEEILQRNNLNSDLFHIYEIENEKYINKYGKTLDWTTKLIYFFDPIDLIPCGISEEEYDIEAKIILDELEKTEPKLEKILELIFNVFEAQFGKLIVGTIDRPCYTSIAKELLIIKKKFMNFTP